MPRLPPSCHSYKFELGRNIDPLFNANAISRILPITSVVRPAFRPTNSGPGPSSSFNSVRLEGKARPEGSRLLRTFARVHFLSASLSVRRGPLPAAGIRGAQTHASAPVSTPFSAHDPLVEAAFEHFYNMEYDRSTQDFEKYWTGIPMIPPPSIICSAVADARTLQHGRHEYRRICQLTASSGRRIAPPTPR